MEGKPAGGTATDKSVGRPSLLGYEAFMGSLAPFYDKLLADFDRRSREIGSRLACLIEEHWQGRVRRVLDAACGVGLRAIGLALRGYRVHAAESSRSALAFAVSEARSRYLSVHFTKAGPHRLDVALDDASGQRFDIVLASPTCFTRWRDDEEVVDALRQLRLCTRPGGACLLAADSESWAAGLRADHTEWQEPAAERREDCRLTLEEVRLPGPAAGFQVVVLRLIERRGGGERHIHEFRCLERPMSTGNLCSLLPSAGLRSIERIDWSGTIGSLIVAEPD